MTRKEKAINNGSPPLCELVGSKFNALLNIERNQYLAVSRYKCKHFHSTENELTLYLHARAVRTVNYCTEMTASLKKLELGAMATCLHEINAIYMKKKK